MPTLGKNFYLMFFPIFFLMVFLLYPSLWLLKNILPENVAEIFNPYYAGRLIWSLFQASLSTTLTIIFGISSAIVFARLKFFGQEFLESFFALPFVVPVVVAAMGFLALFGPQSQMGLELPPWTIIFMANTFYNHAIVFKIVLAALRNTDPETEQVARLDGANEWQVLGHITLPNISAAVFSSAGLVFLYCFTAFGIPLILGRGKYNTLEVEMYTLVSGQLKLGTASALALLQLMIALGISVIYARTDTKNQNDVALQPANINTAQVLKNSAPIRAMLFLTITIFVFTALPLLVLPARAFFLPTGLSAANVVAVFNNTDGVFDVPVGSAIWNTIKFSGMGLIVALLVAVPFALVARKKPKLDVFMLLPLCVSGIMLALAYVVAFPILRATPTLLVAAYALLAYPLIARALLPALRALPSEYFAAAKTDGANNSQIFWRITLPLVREPLAAGMALAFATLAGDFAATLLLTRPEWTTLSTLIYERLSKPGRLGEASVLAMLLLVLCIFGFWFTEKIAKQKN